MLYYILNNGAGYYKYCLHGKPVFGGRANRHSFRLSDRGAAERVLKHLQMLLPDAVFILTGA